MKRTVLLIMVTVLFCFLLCLASNINAQDACEGNFDCDQDVDGTDAAVFKEDFGRSTFKNPCPNCPPPAPVPKTGQDTSFATGDDGNLERGVGIELPNPRFTDNGDGTVTDNLTGLIWLKNANCFGTRTWNNALSDSNGLENGECGLTDGSHPGHWTLPNRRELFSLIDDDNYNPALPFGHPFTNVQSDLYWSSTTRKFSNVLAWYVFMDYGIVDYSTKDDLYYVWPVRGQITDLSDNGELCTANADCASGICECSDSSCTPLTFCSAIRCPCQFNRDGDSSCDGFIFPGYDDFENTCGSTSCDGEGNCL